MHLIWNTCFVLLETGDTGTGFSRETGKLHENPGKVMDSEWNFTSFTPEFYQICASFVTFRYLTSVHIVLPFPQNVANVKFEQRYCHGKSK